MRTIGSKTTFQGKPVTIDAHLGGTDYRVRDANGELWAVEERRLGPGPEPAAAAAAPPAVEATQADAAPELKAPETQEPASAEPEEAPASSGD